VSAEARTGADGLVRYFCTRCKREVSDPADAVCSRCTAPTAETRDQAAYRECTRDPIFLFQRRRWVVLGAPEGYDFDDEGDCVAVDERAESLVDEGGFQERTVLSGLDLAGRVFGEWDTPCALETWDTEHVFLSREEGEAYGRARAYNYRDGWRVYCVCAEGQLADLLSAHGETYWPSAKRVASDEVAGG
jgi:hypothetical protein